MASVIPEIKKILFTTDLSKQMRHAFSHAVGLANQYGASLTILFVVEDNPQIKSQDFVDFLGEKRWAEVRQSYEQEIRQKLIGKKRESDMIRRALGEMLAVAKQDLGVGDLSSDEVVVTQGDVADSILQEAAERKVDLIVMGNHARGRLGEAVAGSVSRSVLRRSHVPVLMVRLPEGN